MVLKLFTKVKESGPLETIVKINNDERIKKITSREMKQKQYFLILENEEDSRFLSCISKWPGIYTFFVVFSAGPVNGEYQIVLKFLEDTA